jgi:spore coat protein U-like protein
MNTLRFLIILIGSLAGCAADAAVTCSASVTSITKGYDPNATGDTVATGSYTISCTRLASDPNTFNWQLGANNGLQPGGGGQNRVQMGGGANRYDYELYRLTPYVNGNRWQDGGGNRFNGTLNFGAGLVATQSGAFDLRLPGPQPVDPAGTYTDTVTVTVRNGSGTMLSQTTFNVSIITIASCMLWSPPGNINLSYTSFQVAAASASTNFGVNCTTGIPYIMALDATSGTLVGLNYTLALSQTASNGTGVAQTFSINGSIAAGQSGTCGTAACSASATRTLTITY